MLVELRAFCAFIKASTLNTGGRAGPGLAFIGLDLVLSPSFWLELAVLLLSAILLLLFSFLLSLITRERGSSWGGGGEVAGELGEREGGERLEAGGSGR